MRHVAGIVVLMLAAGASAQCIAREQLIRQPVNSANITLTLSTAPTCADAWEVTSVDNADLVNLAGDFKAHPSSIFPTAVLAASDRSSEDKDNGAEALLVKDVFPSQEDVPGIWLAQKGIQSVTLAFNPVERPNKVKVYQTINPGGVTKIELIGPDKTSIVVYEPEGGSLDTGVIRCGQRVLIKNARRGTLLELARERDSFTIRVGNEAESEEPALFTVVCPGKTGSGEVNFGDKIKLMTQDEKWYWSDVNDPNSLISVAAVATGVDTSFTIVDPTDESNVSGVKRDQSFALKSNWNRFLEVTDFTKGDLKFSSRIIDTWSTFQMTITGAQALVVNFNAPALPWFASAVKITVDASKVWRGIDAVEIEGIERIYPKFPGLLYSNNIYLSTKTTTPSCVTIAYRGVDKVIRDLRYCWGQPLGLNGKVCSGNQAAVNGGPTLIFKDSCACKPGWIGETCDELACPVGNGGRLCSGQGKCVGPFKNPPTRDCECEASFTGEACEIRRGDWNGYGRTCSAVGDPHWYTFDGAWLNVYRPHVYVELLYYMNPQPWAQNPEDREAIVAYTKPWGSMASIAMEVTFRRGNNYLWAREGWELYHNCNGQNIWQSGPSSVGGFNIHRFAYYFTRIQSQGRSGLTLDVYSWGHPSWGWAYLDIHIHHYEPILGKIENACKGRASCPYDLKGMRGLCGNFDGVAWNDDAPWNNSNDWNTCWQWGWWNCAWWNTPNASVMSRVLMPSDVSFRSCRANHYTPATSGPTSTLLTVADEKVYLQKYADSMRARGGPKLSVPELLSSMEKIQAGDNAVTMENTGMCQLSTVESIFKTCQKDRLACSRKTCHDDFFKKHEVFRSLKEVCTKDGDDYNKMQTVTWTAYTNCIQDSCEAETKEECKDNGDENEIKEYLEDIKENLRATQDAEKKTDEERRKGE